MEETVWIHLLALLLLSVFSWVAVMIRCDKQAKRLSCLESEMAVLKRKLRYAEPHEA